MQQRVDHARGERLHDATIARAQVSEAPERAFELPNADRVRAGANLADRFGGRTPSDLMEEAIGLRQTRRAEPIDFGFRQRAGTVEVVDAPITQASERASFGTDAARNGDVDEGEWPVRETARQQAFGQNRAAGVGGGDDPIHAREPRGDVREADRLCTR